MKRKSIVSIALGAIVLVSLCAACISPTSVATQPNNTSTTPNSTSVATQSTDTSTKKEPYLQDKILVRFKPSIAANAAAYNAASDSASASIGATVIKQYEFVPGLEVVQLPQGLSVTDAIAHYNANANVSYAEPDYVSSLDATTAAHATTSTPDLIPNDP